MAAYYEDADLVRQAALLAVGIPQAQAYVDGNKRTAYIAALVFLRINGRPLTGDHLEFAKQLVAVSTRADGLAAATDRFEAWMRERLE
jgi:death-on-curing protein